MQAKLAIKRFLNWAVTVFVTISSFSAGSDAVDPNLRAEILGGRQILISPEQYPSKVTADFYAMTAEQQTQFLALRREKLTLILKSLRGRIIEDPEIDFATHNGWLTGKAKAIITTIDYLLFQNCKLLVTPGRDIGTLYTAQVVAYWGLGSNVKGVGFELTLLRERTKDGNIRSTLSVDRIQVLKAYVPIPVASASFRVIRFNSLDFGPDEMENVKVDHLPLGPVTSNGQNHLGLGFGSGLAIPPAPFATITGFTAQRIKRKILWTCEQLLGTSET